MKTAVIILTDTRSNSDEAVGRVVSALAVAHEHQRAGETVRVIFGGAGTRWPAVLGQPSHPVHGLYQAVSGSVAGLSCGCVGHFEADDQGLPHLADNAVPGTPGFPSYLALQREGFQILTF